ncbi:MAG: AAA family ATPase [Planctomycetes bacterium]|nr:AAA family ATPase [Planctomycetota bacterium]
MSSNVETTELFELELPLPDAAIQARSERLVGFDARYERLRRDLRLLADPEELSRWSKKHHHKELSLCAAIGDRYPLVIFSGDVGTGKTVTAEAASDRIARETNQDAMIFKLSTRVRGSGKVGEMSTLLNHAFQVVAKQAGKSRRAFLIIDEADSLAAARDAAQSHHEDKVAVNTIIQRIDDLRRHGGRVLVFLRTNRGGALDPAVVRRAARIEQFDRPDEREREELFRLDLDGLVLRDEVFRDLVRLTGPQEARLGFTYSDIRTKLLPHALCFAFPSRPLTGDDLIQAARDVRSSPEVRDI